MRPVWLKTHESVLTFDDLRRGIIPGGSTVQETNAISFCCEWLNGKEIFEFNTSGSTGRPKKVVFQRKQLEASARQTEKALRLLPGYTALICLDTQFIAGAMMVVRCLVTGMNMIVRTPSSNPLAGVATHIDFAAFVPSQLVTIVEQGTNQLNKLRVVIIGGAPLQEEFIERLQDCSPAFYATYGMTETLTHIALQRLNGHDRQDAFHLLPDVQASTDERGCLVVQAPHLGAQPIITNDMVTIVDKTKLRWLGRFDRVINSGGVKVHAEKVEKAAEHVFRELKIQKRFFVSGFPDEVLGERVVLVVESNPFKPEAEDSLRNAFNRYLGKFELPKSFVYVLPFAETSTQKIDRVETLRNGPP